MPRTSTNPGRQGILPLFSEVKTEAQGDEVLDQSQVANSRQSQDSNWARGMALRAAQAASEEHLRASDKVCYTTVVSACKIQVGNKISWGWLMLWLVQSPSWGHLCAHGQVTDWEQPTSRMGRRQSPSRGVAWQIQRLNLRETPGPGEGSVSGSPPHTVAWQRDTHTAQALGWTPRPPASEGVSLAHWNQIKKPRHPD